MFIHATSELYLYVLMLEFLTKRNGIKDCSNTFFIAWVVCVAWGRLLFYCPALRINSWKKYQLQLWRGESFLTIGLCHLAVLCYSFYYRIISFGTSTTQPQGGRVDGIKEHVPSFIRVDLGNLCHFCHCLWDLILVLWKCSSLFFACKKSMRVRKNVNNFSNN